MSTHPDRPTSDSSPQSDQQRSELSELRRSLSIKQDYVRDEDPELFEEIGTFLQVSATLHDGSVASRVQSKLRELKRGNKMRAHRGVDDPEDAFADDCDGCEHYGVNCPMLNRYSVTKTISRVIEEAESDDEVIEKLTDIAIENNCHVVLDELDDCQDSYAELLERGYELKTRAVEAISGSADGSGSETGVTATFDEPSPEDERRVEETIEHVMSDEEDDQ
ncbi:hypothetical protein [Natrinema thermotolerans]